MTGQLHSLQMKIDVTAGPASTSTGSDADDTDDELATDTTSNPITLEYSFLNCNDPFAIQTCYGNPMIDTFSVSGAKITENSSAFPSYWCIRTGNIFKKFSCPSWLFSLGTIVFLYSIILLCQILIKNFTKKTLYAALAKYSAAPDAASTVQGPTRGVPNPSEDNVLLNDDEKPSDVPDRYLRLFQIEFLCKVLSLGDSAFGALASMPGMAMYISEAIVFSYERFFSKLNLGLDGNLLDHLRPNTDPETFRWIYILTSPTTLCRHVENMAWQLVLDAAENILLPCAQDTVSRTRDTIVYFMSLSRPLVKMALVLR